MSYVTCHLGQGVIHKVMRGILQLTSSKLVLLGIGPVVHPQQIYQE